MNDFKKNPFIFGKAVAGKYFVDRENDINELKFTLLSGQHVVLFSPRKMGKTSLMKQTFGQTKERVCIHIDLWQIASSYALAKEIIDRVINSTYSSIEKLSYEIKDLFRSLRPKVYIDADGHIGIEFSKEEVREAVKESLEFPEKVARKKGLKMIIAFDEFQEIEHLDGLRMEKIFRSILQHHENVAYIFAGSERSLINIMFGGRERPFYRFAKPIELKPIDKNVLENFIINKFVESGKKIDKNAARWIADFSDGIPYYVQHICHEVWYITEKVAKIKTVEESLKERILPGLSSGFHTIWNEIKSEAQRKLLIGLANEENPKIYSHNFIEKYGLKLPGNVGKAVKSLEKTGLIEKNRIWDLFFKEWIKMNFSY
ncbi:MAG: ATP-binding protein [Candidatus Thermoplasmatota archaeon]|nr:ATP-binding protein [Candidatus Thermoplasmatota archaeon]